MRSKVKDFQRLLSASTPDAACESLVTSLHLLLLCLDFLVVEKVKEAMEGIETSIMAFKAKQREM